MKVRVKRVERINWGAKNPITNRIQLKFENCVDKWCPGLDKTTGMLKTGLTSEEERSFEEKLGLEPKTLMKSSLYWDSFVILIPDDGIELDDSIPMQALMLKVLKADSEVAGSLEEAKANIHAKLYLTTIGGEARVKNSRRENIAKAYSIYYKMTDTDVKDALYMFGKDPSTTDNEICKNMLGEELEKDPAKFLRLLDDEDLKDKVWLIRLIRLGIIKKVGAGLGYDNLPLFFGDIRLGKGLDESVAFLKETENQNVYKALKEAQKEALKTK